MVFSRLKAFPWASLGIPEDNETFAVKCLQQEGFLHLLQVKPKISLVLVSPSLGCSFRQDQFETTLESVLAQTYADWELLIPFQEPSDWKVALEKKYSDSRIRWLPVNTAFAAEKKNEALEKATGKWVGFVEWTDVLSPALLYFLLMSLQGEGDAEVLITNEARIDEKSVKSFHFLSKPKLSWFDLIHFNYVGRFWMIKRELLAETGSFDATLTCEHEHDLLLRAHEKQARFRTIPLFLYYQRQEPKSDLHEKCRLIEAHLQRMQIPAKVWEHQASGKTFLKVTPHILNPTEHLVSVIICFRNKAEMTIECLQNLLDNAGQGPLEVIVVNNESEPSELKKVHDYAARSVVPIKVVDYAHAFNFAHMHNWAVKEHCRGKYLFLLNNDVFMKSPRFLDEMVAWAQFAWVGTVGALLRYPDGTIQHAGFKTLFGSFTRIARVYHVQDERGFPYDNKEVFGNTFAACLIQRATFEKSGGLRELELSNGFGDVAFNFSCLRQGLKNLYLGHVEGIHLESASRGAEYEYWEYLWLEKQYPEILQQMLRDDLGYDRLPGPKAVLKEEIRSRLQKKLAAKSWLRPLSRFFEI